MTKRLCVLLLAIALLGRDSLAFDIVVDGHTLRDCSVGGVTRTGVQIIHSVGVSQVDFRVLPPYVQKRLHYDAVKGRSDYARAAMDAFEWCWAVQRQQDVRDARIQAQRAADLRAKNATLKEIATRQQEFRVQEYERQQSALRERRQRLAILASQEEAARVEAQDERYVSASELQHYMQEREQQRTESGNIISLGHLRVLQHPDGSTSGIDGLMIPIGGGISVLARPDGTTTNYINIGGGISVPTDN